jgi:hypothetical protein
VELELESAIQAKDDGYGPRENPSMTLINQESYFTCSFAQLLPIKKEEAQHQHQRHQQQQHQQ